MSMRVELEVNITNNACLKYYLWYEKWSAQYTLFEALPSSTNRELSGKRLTGRQMRIASIRCHMPQYNNYHLKSAVSITHHFSKQYELRNAT